jgi:hypothetical protein
MMREVIEELCSPCGEAADALSIKKYYHKQPN